MATSTAPAPLRRGAAAVSLGATAAGLGLMAGHDLSGPARWGLAGVAALTAAGALGLSRRSVVSQVLSRGMAWVVLIPAAVGVFAALVSSHAPDIRATFLAATSAAALLLARAALHSKEARAEFAPIAYRSWFLAGAVSSVTAGIVLLANAFFELVWAGTWPGLGLLAMGAAMVASAVGVARMRAWGVLLGAASASAMLGASLMSSDAVLGVMIALGALPGALLVGPVLASRVVPPVAPVEMAPPVEGPRLAHGDLYGAEPEGVPAVRARVELAPDAELQEARVEDPGTAEAERVGGRNYA